MTRKCKAIKPATETQRHRELTWKTDWKYSRKSETSRPASKWEQNDATIRNGGERCVSERTKSETKPTAEAQRSSDERQVASDEKMQRHKTCHRDTETQRTDLENGLEIFQKARNKQSHGPMVLR